MNFRLLGARIRSTRKNLHLTQEQLAEKTGVSTNFIGQIERGERKLSIETLVAISNELGTSVDFLLRDSTRTADIQISEEIMADVAELSMDKKLLLRDFVSRYKDI